MYDVIKDLDNDLEQKINELAGTSNVKPVIKTNTDRKEAVTVRTTLKKSINEIDDKRKAARAEAIKIVTERAEALTAIIQPCYDLYDGAIAEYDEKLLAEERKAAESLENMYKERLRLLGDSISEVELGFIDIKGMDTETFNAFLTLRKAMKIEYPEFTQIDESIDYVTEVIETKITEGQGVQLSELSSSTVDSAPLILEKLSDKNELASFSTFAVRLEAMRPPFNVIKSETGEALMNEVDKLITLIKTVL